MQIPRAIPFIFVMFLFCFDAVAAPSRTGRVEGGLEFAAAFPTDRALSEAPYFGGSIAYGFNEWVAVGFSVGYQDSSIDFKDAAGVKIEGPSWGTTSFFGDILLRSYDEESPVLPYGVLGLGGFVSHPHGTGVLSDRNLETDSNDSFAVKIGGGIDWFTTESWIFNIEARYVFASADAVVRNRSTQTEVDSVDLSTWAIGFGIKWFFN